MMVKSVIAGEYEDALVDWVVRHFDPTNRLRNLPVPVSIAPIQIKSGRFEIGLERR